jgi:hypothetical protein
MSGAMLTYGYRHPRTAGALLSYVSLHADDSGRRADLRQLSQTAHYVGMELSVLHLTLGEALEDCGYAFKAACMHGVVMERLDRQQPAAAHVAAEHLVRSFLGFCAPVAGDTGYYRNCLHAVGHELWARTRLSLAQTLGLCDVLRRGPDLDACWSGVLMEYSEGPRANGRHLHAPAGRRSLPCSSLNVRQREVCTYAEASYRQYVPGWEPPRTTYGRCATSPRAYRLECMTLVSERLLIARSGRPDLANATCAQLTAPEARVLCYRSIMRLQTN